MSSVCVCRESKYQIAAFRRHSTEDPMEQYMRQSPRMMAEYLRQRLELETKELCGVLVLNANEQPVGFAIIASGVMVHIQFHPKDILLPAVRYGGASLVMFHSYPDREPELTKVDLKLARVLIDAAENLGITLWNYFGLNTVTGKFVSMLNNNAIEVRGGESNGSQYYAS